MLVKPSGQGVAPVSALSDGSQQKDFLLCDRQFGKDRVLVHMWPYSGCFVCLVLGMADCFNEA